MQAFKNREIKQRNFTQYKVSFYISFKNNSQFSYILQVD